MTTKENKWSYETEQIVDKLCLFDDDFMVKIFEENIPCTEFVIRTLLEERDLSIVDVKVQKEIRNNKGYRSIRLDIIAEDKSGRRFNIEVQQADNGAVPQRARYHSARIDSRLLKANEEFKSMKDSYVIFLTRNDVLAGGKPIYHIERTLKNLVISSRMVPISYM